MKRYFQKGFDIADWLILLVDDDKMFVKMMKKNFMRNGVWLLTARTGEEALEVAKKRQPSLIIMDQLLPGLNGQDICLELKESGRTREIPIIFLTVKDSPDEIAAEMEAGAISHFTKPVGFKELYSEIQKILGT